MRSGDVTGATPPVVAVGVPEGVTMDGGIAPGVSGRGVLLTVPGTAPHAETTRAKSTRYSINLHITFLSDMSGQS